MAWFLWLTYHDLFSRAYLFFGIFTALCNEERFWAETERGVQRLSGGNVVVPV